MDVKWIASITDEVKCKFRNWPEKVSPATAPPVLEWRRRTRSGETPGCRVSAASSEPRHEAARSWIEASG